MSPTVALIILIIGIILLIGTGVGGIVSVCRFIRHRMVSRKNGGVRITKTLSNINLYNTHVDTRALRNQLREIVGGQPFFAEVLFTNKSSSKLKAEDALDVWGEITVINQNGQEAFPSMRGRWGHSKERRQDAQPRDQDVRNIYADGYPEPMLIAIKHQEEELAYGLNGENEIKDISWRDPNKPIPAGTYHVKIALQGRNLNEPKEFPLTLINKGKGFGIELIKGMSVLNKEGS
ncbi:hypothetical protein ACFLT4_05230 [Chloroflexota bacterium]